MVQDVDRVLAPMERGRLMSMLGGPDLPGNGERFTATAPPRYVVPEGMVQVAMTTGSRSWTTNAEIMAALEAAVQWLAENPIAPTDRQAGAVWRVASKRTPVGVPIVIEAVQEWQRKMFLAPAPEYPEGLKPLFWVPADVGFAAHNRAVLDAYELGKRSAAGK